ncbi:MAG: hypothetical protein GWN30_01030 [Gammaproteobacteria bacterium]|nr:hypothetical protein [Gammaproteobacteria bacterium]
MDASNQEQQLFLQLDMGDELDPDQLDQLTRQLHREIFDHGIDEVDFVRGDDVPEGAKSAETVTWGALAISVLPTVVPQLIEFLKSWTMRGESRKVRIVSKVGDKSVELEYTPSGVDNQELKEMIAVLTSGMQEPSEPSADDQNQETE